MSHQTHDLTNIARKDLLVDPTQQETPMTETKTKFEIRNEEVELLLRKLAEFINGLMPKGWGFTLLIFDYSKPEATDAGSMFYISSGDRKDMIKAMMEFIDKQQEDQTKN